MAYSDWEWGRIRARLIVYYYKKQDDLIDRVRMRADIRSKENSGLSEYTKSYTDDPPKQTKTSDENKIRPAKEANEPDVSSKFSQLKLIRFKSKGIKSAKVKVKAKDDAHSETQDKFKEKRDSSGWVKVAYNILKSETNNLTDPGSPASIKKEKPDRDWDLKGESLRRYYTGDDAKASKNTGGFPTRTIPRPKREIVEKAIHDFLHSIGYLDKADIEEPDSWLTPDDNVMDVMGFSQSELRISTIPHMLSRDYVSRSSEEEKFATALMSVYTRYSHDNCKVRYITQENFRTNSSNQANSGNDKNWKWYWGWLLFDSAEATIVKIVEDNPIYSLQYSFWLDKFKDNGEKVEANSKDITEISMSAPIEIHSSTTDQRLVELMRESYSPNRSSFRTFVLSKMKSLTYILNSYRFIGESKDRSPVAGYAPQIMRDLERLALDQLNEHLASIFNSRTGKIIPFEGRDNGMSKDEVYYSGVILHEEPGTPRHVMNLTLDEVVSADRLSERLIHTISIGFPWHIAELIELGADPNYLIPESGGCALHLMASTSSNGHLREFIKGVKTTKKNLTLNIKTDKGQLPSDIAAQYCVNPEITEYLFAMEKLERDLGKGHMPADDLIPFEDGDFIKTHGYPLDDIGPEIYEKDEDGPETPGL